MKKIDFIALQTAHFPLLLEWLNTPHVKTWWDSDVEWNIEKIADKYDSYVHGFKVENSIKKPIHAFLIRYEQTPIGYIQYYNAYDFARELALLHLPDSLAAVDIYIGELSYLGHGIGSMAVSMFLEQFVFPHYEAVFADPDIRNIAAIQSYEKAGFKRAKIQSDDPVLRMLCFRNKEMQMVLA